MPTMTTTSAPLLRSATIARTRWDQAATATSRHFERLAEPFSPQELLMVLQALPSQPLHQSLAMVQRKNLMVQRAAR